jgi:hypothetical protein
MKLQARWRITDDWSCAGSGCGGPHDQPATTTDLDFSVPVDCDGTSAPSIGSTCQVDTSANAVAPGAVKVNGDAVVQTFRTRLVDSGPNGILDDSDDRLFAQQGIYIP